MLIACVRKTFQKIFRVFRVFRGPKVFYMETLSSQERQSLEAVEGIIFDVQRYSVHDGPGLRTDVFFKGCPLRCGWCSNPESQVLQPEQALFSKQCMRCDQFAEVCPLHWEDDHKQGWTQELEEKYRERVKLCPTEAIHEIGECRRAGDIVAEVLRDLPFYRDGGGMTLTGGDPTMQPDLAEALLRLTKAEGINTAMETCGHAQWDVFERLLPFLDHILFDIKHLDPQVHRQFTGQGNGLILSNAAALVKHGAPLSIRVPLIPGFNANAQALRDIAEFVKRIQPAKQSIDILPYHTLGTSKYTALGRGYPWEGHKRLTDEELEELLEPLKASGLEINVGG